MKHAVFETDLEQAIYRILEANGFAVPRRERRASRRYPLHQPVTVTPIDSSSGRARNDQAFDGFVLDISAGGFGLLVPRLLTTEQAVLSFWNHGRAWCHMLFQPCWTKFSGQGYYQIGGRFLGVLPENFCSPSGPPEWDGPAEL